jgi:hypothetical protein
MGNDRGAAHAQSLPFPATSVFYNTQGMLP